MRCLLEPRGSVRLDGIQGGESAGRFPRSGWPQRIERTGQRPHQTWMATGRRRRRHRTRRPHADDGSGLRSSHPTPQGCEEVEHPAHGAEVASVQSLTHRCCVGRHDCLERSARTWVQIPALAPNSIKIEVIIGASASSSNKLLFLSMCGTELSLKTQSSLVVCSEFEMNSQFA